MATVFDVLARFRADVTDYTTNVNKAERETDRFVNTVDKGSVKAGGMFGALLGPVSRIGMAIVGVTQTAGMMGIRTAMANEQAAIGFKVMLGSAQEAKVFMDELIEFSSKTPFELPQLRTAASALLSTGVEAQKVIPIMQALGDATAAKGYGADAIQRAVYALQQMSTAGRATGQDMMQLTQAGVPIWESLAYSLGKTIPEIKKLGESGQISAEQVMTAIQAYAGPGMEKVKGMMVEQSGTLTGLLSTLKDTVGQSLGTMMEPAVASIKQALPQVTTMIDELLKSIGPTVNEVVGTTLSAITSLLPALTPAIIGFGSVFTAILQAVAPFIPMLAEALVSLTPVFESVALAVTELGNILLPIALDVFPILMTVITQATSLFSSLVGFLIENKDVIIALGGAYLAFKATMMGIMIVQKLIGFFKLLTSAQAMATAQTWLFNSALYANPIGLIVAAIVGLIAGVVLMYKKFEWFRDLVRTVWNGIVDIIQGAINLILGYYEWFINGMIDGVNLLIKAWNAVSWGTDIQPLKDLNLELDITSWKIDEVADKANKLKMYNYGSGGMGQLWTALGPTDRTKTDPKPPTLGGGGGGGSKNTVLENLRNQLKKTYEDAINVAKENLSDLRSRMDEFTSTVKDSITANVGLADSFKLVVSAQQQETSRLDSITDAVKSAVMGVVKFTDILGNQKGAQEALNQAQQQQSAIQDELAKRQATVNELVRQYENAIPGRGKEQIYGMLAQAVQDLSVAQQALAENTKAVASAQKDADTAGTGFIDGFRKQLQAAEKFAQQIVTLRNLGLNESLIKQVASAGAIAGGSIAEELISGGATAITEANSIQTSLENLATTTGTSVATTFAQTGTTLAQDLLASMQTEADKATAFAEKIKTLVSMGLSYDNIQNVISAGAQAGTSIADALISGGKTAIDQANAIQASLTSMATNTANSVSGSFYNAGVTMAEAVVAGLESVLFTIAPSIAKMTTAQVTAAQGVATTTTSQFGNLPTTVGVLGGQATNLANGRLANGGAVINGVYLPPGLDFSGFHAKGGIATRASFGVIGESGPEAIMPLSQLDSMLSGGGGGGMNITINVSGSVISEKDLIEQVRVGLLRAQKSGRQVVL